MEICLESIFEEEPEKSEDNHKTAADTLTSTDLKSPGSEAVAKDADGKEERILSFDDNIDQEVLESS